MADAAPRGRGGFGRGRGERGRGRRGPRRGGRKDEEKEWVPVTKLGRLVKDGKIKSIEEIYLFSLPVKEYQIIDFFLPKLKDEVMKIMPVQKQTRAGQRTRFKAFVAIGDSEGHVGLGVKCAKEVATAIRGAIILAKLSVIPVRRGYWGAALGEPHTVPSKVSGKVGSVMCRLIPAPRGTGIVAAPASKRLLQLAGVEDVYTQSKGSTATMGNFLKATFAAITKTYAFLTPDLWREIPLSKFPYDEHSAHLQLAAVATLISPANLYFLLSMQVMYSARTAADSRHSKSLLHSRSLRDFRTPPSSRADKPRCRILRVNGPHVVREPYPSVPGLIHTYVLLLIRFGSHSPHSSIQVSPFIAAPRTGFDGGVASSPASSHESSPSLALRRPSMLPSGTGVHELRKPLVDPRRHRRLCSDFGLNRKEARDSPIFDVSSLASTPLTTYTEADSDSDVSINQSLDYSLSPMFDLGEADQVIDLLRKRWGVSIQISKPLPALFHQLDSTSNISIDSRHTYDLEGLDMTCSTVHQASANNAPRNCFTKQHSSFVSQKLASSPLPSLPGAGKDNSWKRATTATVVHNRQSEAASLPLARSASSIGLREDSSIKASIGPAAQKPFGALPLELSEYIDRLDLSIEKLKAHDPRQLSSLGAAVLEEDRKKREFRMSLSPPSLASAGRKKPMPRPYVPLPTFRPDPGHPSTPVPPKVSWAPSDRRPMRNQPTVPSSIPKSFMDITPEREAERGPRSRMRKLLARASVSMFSWGKTASRVKSIAKVATMD
ncbi:40S ribosomal protein S2 [Termitomyces sp. J132]|nr:40S ribosomal protein S2 [Termitomyces sp. J132]